MLHLFNRLKKCIVIFLVILLTGCKAQYDIEINDNTNLKETITITEENKDKFNKKDVLLYNLTPKQYLETNLKWPTTVYIDDEINPYEPIKIYNTKYYTKTNISNYRKVGVVYSFIHKQNNYNKTDIINKCYDFKYNKLNDVITFETTGEFKCFEKYKMLEELTINANTLCNVVYENSDYKEKNRYIWNINKFNYKNKSIKFKFDCNIKQKEINKSIISPIIIISYLLLILLVILIVKIRWNKNNEI